MHGMKDTIVYMRIFARITAGKETDGEASAKAQGARTRQSQDLGGESA